LTENFSSLSNVLPFVFLLQRLIFLLAFSKSTVGQNKEDHQGARGENGRGKRLHTGNVEHLVPLDRRSES
jgi:hypothetical protein